MKTGLKFPLVSAVLCLVSVTAQSQLLHTESFSVIIDTSKTIKGNLSPYFRYRNVKRDFIEIENVADMSFLLGQNAFTVANKLEFARFGTENILSGGFVYLEYQHLDSSRKIAIEPYAYRLWQEIRGLREKYATGINFRGALVNQPNIGLFVGVGGFYEWEEWNYAGVNDAKLIPTNPRTIYVSGARGSAYLSLVQTIGKSINLDFSFYYQPGITSDLSQYRLGLNTRIIYQITKYIGFQMRYRGVYDSAPIVPVSDFFHDYSMGVNFSF
ncbi:MAG: hypothetical protein Salg2KO_20300 [Salibacteraceae bacterium]